ncbi:MAG: ABC transporter permease [Bacteroidales bacterium]|nr:ABC transporter permease [Bacteroidales bacterium]
MKKILTLVYKDFLILIRDKWGLGLLFAMPMALVLIMTAMQDTTFRSIHESGISMVLLNNDLDSLGNAVEKEVCKSDFFDCNTTINGRKPAESEIREAVAAGKFQIGIIIPENTTGRIRERVKTSMQNLFSGGGINPANTDSIYISLYIDPAIRSSLRTSLQGKIREYASKIETRIFLNELTVEINKQMIISVANLNLLQPQTVTCREEYVAFGNRTAIPNSVQHNIPSWTLFAMFFIVIPFAGAMIKEREDGNLGRLLTMPVSYSSIMLSRVLVYLLVCYLQFILIMLMGIYLFPLLNLPSLNIEGKILSLSLMAVFASLAAVSYGIAIGTIAQTHQQAAIFGSVSVMILAALGGIWVPVFIMPPFLKSLSIISPMNWALNSFYDILVRNASLSDVLHYGIRLVLFSAVGLLTAIYFNRIRKELT